MNQPNQNYKTALVTGASEGIGLELARLMASKGWNLILTARREDLLKELAAATKKKFGVQTSVFPGDLSDPAFPKVLYDQIHDAGLSVDALINNAGFGMVGAMKDADQDRIFQMLQLNIVSLTRLTSLFIPDFINKGLGWIMNVGSVAGFQSMPYFNVYAASKAYVLHFSEALSVELEKTGITVTCLAPGPTRTGFSQAAGYKRTRSETGSMNAAAVAQLGYEGMMQGKRLVVTGGTGKFTSFLQRFVPRTTIADLAGAMMVKRLK